MGAEQFTARAEGLAGVLPESAELPGPAGLGVSDGGDGVASRIDLQQIFTRPKQPTKLLAVVDEAALRRRVGSDEIMYRQLAHLAEVGQRTNIGIQVVHARHGGNAGHVGAFTIASLPDAPDVLLMEAVQDVTTDEPPAIMQAHAIFDRVRWDALSRSQSLEYIMELAEQWRQ